MDLSGPANRGSLRDASLDLGFAAVVAVVTPLAVFALDVHTTALAFLIVPFFSLFLPGYVVTVAVFPERGSDRASDVSPPAGRIDGLERTLLSVALSVVVVPLVGIGLILAGVGLRLVPVVVAIAAVVLVGAVVAERRRSGLPPDERFRPPIDVWLAGARDALRPWGSRTSTAVNIAIAISVLFAAGSLAYAIDTPNADPDTEFYLLSEDDSGDLVAADYPSEFRRGQAEPVTIAVANHEHRPVNYSVAVQIQRVEVRNGTVDVRDRTQLDTFRLFVPSGERAAEQRRITPSMSGDELRLVFLLYRGSPPPSPTIDDAYRSTYIWVNVTS